jgi:hypothetical protein
MHLNSAFMKLNALLLCVLPHFVWHDELRQSGLVKAYLDLGNIVCAGLPRYLLA